MYSIFLGKLHPLIVHLPIGILLLYLILDLLNAAVRVNATKELLKFILVIGIASSLLSLLSGYILSLDEGYNEDILNKHKWIAIITVVCFSAYGYFNLIRQINKKNKIITVACLFILISTTGHFGGTLTHGEDYWTFSIVNNNETPIAYNVKDIENALVFEDLIMYSLNQKCVECHGPNKQKGSLRLDSKEWILKGGKNGTIINLSDSKKSELLKRILLDINEEYHMPPKKKEQLFEEEKTIIEWWIASGAPFNVKVSALGKTNEINSIIQQFHKKITSQQSIKSSERESISPLTSSKIDSLKALGWNISPLSKNDNHIRITGFNVEQPLDSCLKQLIDIKDHIVELKLSFKELNEKHIETISSLSNLEKLWLDHTTLNSKSLKFLTKLEKLAYLNLSYNELKYDDLISIRALKKLEKLYIMNTGINNEEVNKLKGSMPDKLIFATSDTMLKVQSDTIFKKPIS